MLVVEQAFGRLTMVFLPFTIGSLPGLMKTAYEHPEAEVGLPEGWDLKTSLKDQ